MAPIDHQLPHVNTLKKYINFTDVTTGFNPDILERLATEANIHSMEERKKHVIIAFDEMQIKSNLVYRKNSGRLIGFTEMGELNEEFSHFSSIIEEKDDDIQRSLSTHVIVFMVRGICSSLIQPFGYFASRGMTSSQLYCCTFEAVRVLTALNFKVRALVSDGAAANRKAYRIMAEDNKNNSFWTNNPHQFGLAIYFFSDVPHLLKTTRNCLENLKWNKNSRNMHLDGQDITWQHIVDVYEDDLGVLGGTKEFALLTRSPGLRKLHKITEEHIKLSSRSRMTVKFAAQVLSQTVANALKSQGRHDTESITKFIVMIDRVFDFLNVSKLNEGRNSKKELAGYKSPDDWRFDFLIKGFVNGYLERWETQVNSKINLSKEEKRRQLLSLQTRDGWKMTIRSFVTLAKELLQIEGVKLILSEKFSQDPLEEHFGRQRRKGGTNDNPNLLEFGRQENALNVMKSELIQDIRGNARGADREKRKINVNDIRSLPKGKKSKKSF